jgi:Flp pilus assembly protein TadB
VAERTGLSHDEAQKRVDDAISQEKAAEAKVRQAADTARKSAAAFAIFTAISMLIGAFIACASAAFGGSLRDEHP